MMEQEFEIEGGTQSNTRPSHIRVEAVEGTDSIKIDAPEGIAMHLLTEFRARQDRLRGQSMADAERLTAMRREMLNMGEGRTPLVTSSH
jgi:hypothetical protein